jgi:NAD-dependent deacetylase
MKKLTVLTGAGISAESGISTFRDSGGLWEQYPVMQVASHTGWLNDPELVNRFYNERRKQLFQTQPCGAHKLLAELENDFSVSIVTQNIDDLHERAGSTDVIHLHGELKKVCSSADVENPRYWKMLSADDCCVKPGERAGDGSLLRPYIVFFEEAVPMISAAADKVAQTDIFVIIGTSLNVYPAAGLIDYAPAGTPVYLIDPKDVKTPHGVSVTHIKAGATEGMKQLVAMLRNM